MDSKRIRVIVKDILDRYPLLEDDRIKLADFLAGAYNSGGGGGSQESLKLGITKGTAYEGSSGETNRLAIKELNDRIVINGNGDKFLSDNGQYVQVKSGIDSIPKADNTIIGGILLGYQHNNKNYAVLLDEEGRAYVQVPWTDTIYNKASDTSLGLIKIGYTANNKNYPVLLNGEGKAYVNVPWTDNDTTYEKVTQSKDGLMSKEDKTKLDGLTGAYIQIITKNMYNAMYAAGTLDENTVYHIKG